jgi:hypothetical protein
MVLLVVFFDISTFLSCSHTLLVQSPPLPSPMLLVVVANLSIVVGGRYFIDHKEYLRGPAATTEVSLHTRHSSFLPNLGRITLQGETLGSFVATHSDNYPVESISKQADVIVYIHPTRRLHIRLVDTPLLNGPTKHSE